MQERVTDVDDPRLADYARLTDMDLRTHTESAHGLFIAEGTKVIGRAVAAGYPVRSLLLTERRLGDLKSLPATAAPVYLVPDAAAERSTRIPRTRYCGRVRSTCASATSTRLASHAVTRP